MLLPLILAVVSLGAASLPSLAAGQASDIPDWLQAHVGTGEGQIAPVVLERARALHQRKVGEGAVHNGCYFAMDATRPSTSPDGALGRRFYIICEADQTFRAVSSGYGNGRKLSRADFSNGRECAKNFSNAEGSKLTMGGDYVTAEPLTSFKGYTSVSGKKTPFLRTFLQFEGEGETANARERAIGGHPAVYVKWQCRYKNAESPYADEEGYVPYGSVVNYTGGRSNGCTSWSPSDSEEILAIVQDNPTTLYIYPESFDIDAVAQAVKDRTSLSDAGLYWNAACLKAIGTPRFWPKGSLEPIIDAWRESLPPPGPPAKLPICR
ncbi:MAG: murein L,D-transpeptidase catalytic domain family protein [Bauldia sp.]|nr:murein L,D-transpeptidase catalytic domain family protein [Bauldia sp.]